MSQEQEAEVALAPLVAAEEAAQIEEPLKEEGEAEAEAALTPLAEEAEAAPEEASLPSSETEDVEVDPLHIGNLISVLSDAHGFVVGRVVYRDENMVRVMPQEVSDRAIEFSFVEEGNRFAPELGVKEIEVLEVQGSDYYVDFLGAQPGDILEFFTLTGDKAREPATVAEIIKTATKDSLKLEDGTILRFKGVGPQAPIAVIRVRSSLNVAAGPAPEDAPEVAAAAAETRRRQTEMMTLLMSVLPEPAPQDVRAGGTYPESMQREDLFQDLRGELTDKQRTNPRRIRFIEREVDLAIALKNKSVLRDDVGTITGPAPHVIATMSDVVNHATGPLPAAIPIVDAAHVLNLDIIALNIQTRGATAPVPIRGFDDSQVALRQIFNVEEESLAKASQYSEGVAPSDMENAFVSYIYDMYSRDLITLKGSRTTKPWIHDQDVLRTAKPDVRVQGLSSNLPQPYIADAPPLTTDYIINNIHDRSIRVLTGDTIVHPRTRETFVIAPSDPSKIAGYVMLPIKAAITLRPPKNPGDLPTALLYSAGLKADNLPTITQTLKEIYRPETEKAPDTAWALDTASTSDVAIASWLDTVLKYAVHPMYSLAPRTPQMLSVLDSLGVGDYDLAPDVADVVQKWVRKSQGIWRRLLLKERERITTALKAEPTRAFQTVTGDGSPTWQAIKASAELRELIDDITRQQAAISEAPTVLTAALLMEAQGDAAPLVWTTLARADGRTLGIDPVTATTALAASRSYGLRRKVLRDYILFTLKAEPEINACPHVKRLEAIRNQGDGLQRSRLLREFVEEYQGGKSGNWITCALCKQECVCYHELMELEAMAQPSRMEAIQRQILVRFGGDRYEGKIVCKNCGQPLQDIDYDEHVEFDDDGNPIVSRSVLTQEQMEEGPTTSTWRKETAALVAPPVEFTVASQKQIAVILNMVMQRGGIVAPPEVIRFIVTHADIYVSARAPAKDAYMKVYTEALKRGKQAFTYDTVIIQLRVAAVLSLLAISLQLSDPYVTVTNKEARCPFSREGWPLGQGEPDKGGPLLYLACVTAFIDTQGTPMAGVSWEADNKVPSRQNKIHTIAIAATKTIIGGGEDKKTAPLPFTAAINQMLDKERADTELKVKRSLVSLKDQLPHGFRPEPFPPALGRPGGERDPLPAITAAISAGESTAPMVESVGSAIRQQAIAIVHELHTAAADAPASKSIDAVCCSVSLREADAGALLGEGERASLVQARAQLYGAIPSTVTAGTHLWPIFDTPVTGIVSQTVDEGVYFKLFLKYCYNGPQVGEFHEFGVGNICRQCGLSLGKPLDLIDFATEGSAILAAQQGDLRVETSQAAFDALSDAVRRRKIIRERVVAARETWMMGLEKLTDAGEVGEKLGQVLASIQERSAAEAELTDVERALLWGPVTEHVDDLKTEIMNRLAAVGEPRRKEIVAAMSVFDSMTEDPFVEGPRAVQEYWCAKSMMAGAGYGVRKVDGSRWFDISPDHNKIINGFLEKNAEWYGGEVTDAMSTSLRLMAYHLGPILRTWIQHVRKGNSPEWTIEEAQLLLRAFVLQAWHDVITPGSWIYERVAGDAKRQEIATAVGVWTRGLMLHVKQQFIRYSKEKIKQILQQRAELERTSIVEELGGIKDEDLRAAALIQKQLRIGRWGIASKGFGKYDADLFEFEREQREKMGVVDAPVDRILVEGAAQPAAANDFGFGPLAAGPGEGYMGMDTANDD